jgi:hypothetical protein
MGMAPKGSSFERVNRPGIAETQVCAHRYRKAIKLVLSWDVSEIHSAETNMSNAYRILVAIDLKPGTDLLLAEAQRYHKALDATLVMSRAHSRPNPAATRRR